MGNKDIQKVSESDTLSGQKQIEISTLEGGRTQIVFKKALMKGRVTNGEVLNTILIAAKMQAEYLIQKLSRGAPLDASEVKMLKEMAEITKLDTPKANEKPQQSDELTQLESVKSALYLKLSEKLKQP